LESKRHFERGRYHSKWKFYSVNGHLYSVIPYVNGLKEGQAKYYHNNGKLASIGRFKGDLPLPETWLTYNKAGEVLDCHCPPPSEAQISAVAMSVYEMDMASAPRHWLTYGYQENLWLMSCVDIQNDSLDVIKKKVTTMWNLYRELLVANNYPTSLATDKNILKFSVDMGFTTLFTELLKRYKVDMNFIDPRDGKTILDFIEERIKFIRTSPPVDTDKAELYESFVKLLKNNGVQHHYEIKKPSDYVLYEYELIERD